VIPRGAGRRPRLARDAPRRPDVRPHHHSNDQMGPAMTETEELTRRALQESMDLRDQGHCDD